MRNFFYKFFAILLGLLFSLVLAEFGLRATIYRNAINAEEQWRAFKNAYVEQIKSIGSNCNFTDSLKPHPFLAFVHNEESKCKIQTNNLGFINTPDLPPERAQDKFIILISGGSVAANFATNESGHGNDLENFLNKNYISPNGKPFLVISAALGEWAFPQPLIALSLLSQRTHAFITLVGYNEALNIQFQKSIETAPFNYLLLTGNKYSGSLFFISFIQGMRKIALETPLKNSYLAYFVYSTSLNFFANSRFGIANLHYQQNNKQFAIPYDWSPGKKEAWHKENFKRYMRLTAALAKAESIYFANFIQPTRQAGKKLTNIEKDFFDPLDYAVFKNIVISGSKELAKDHHTFLLTDIFQDEPAQIYSDHIHFHKDERGQNRGNIIMAEAMGKILAREWRLRKK